MRIIELFVFLVLMIPPYPVMLYKMCNRHRMEFKKHGPGFIFYTTAVIIFKGSQLQEYIYGWKHIFNGGSYDQTTLSVTYSAWKLIGWQVILVVFVISIFKKDTDLFMSFSKIDCQAQVSQF